MLSAIIDLSASQLAIILIGGLALGILVNYIVERIAPKPPHDH